MSYYGRSDEGNDPDDDDSPVGTCPVEDCGADMDVLVDGGLEFDDVFRCHDCGHEATGEQLYEQWRQRLTEETLMAADEGQDRDGAVGPCVPCAGPFAIPEYDAAGREYDIPF